MAAVDEQLIHADDGLALLFAPPFDRTPLDPGYIKGYPPASGKRWPVHPCRCMVGHCFRRIGDGDKALVSSRS